MKPSRPSEISVRPDESVDEFMEGRLKLIQSRKGYRFSIDAVLLSNFVSIREGDLVVDLGTGCGIIPLILLLTRPVRFACGLEIQAELAHQAIRNASLNGFADRMGVVMGDIKRPPLTPFSADVVVCNPPYRKAHSGRINPDPQRAIARHEMLASLNDFLNTSQRLLKPKGRLAVIYPAFRLVDILISMRGFDLEPKRVRPIYADAKSDSKLVLVEASSGGRKGLQILPPLIGGGISSIIST